MATLFFLPAFLLVLGLGGYLSRLALYGVYRVTGGKRPFWAWYKLMQFQEGYIMNFEEFCKEHPELRCIKRSSLSSFDEVIEANNNGFTVVMWA